jgi:hypothetical protein
MAKELKFNICDLQTSFLPNDQVSDMANRVNSCISDGLLYSCIQWASHLESTSESFRVDRAGMEQAIQACHPQTTSLEKRAFTPLLIFLLTYLIPWISHGEEVPG